jgi:hypothetical protein
MNLWWLGFICEFPLELNRGHIVIVLQYFVKFMYTCSIKEKLSFAINFCTKKCHLQLSFFNCKQLLLVAKLVVNEKFSSSVL